MKTSIYVLFATFLSGVIWTSCQREGLPDASGLHAMEPEIPVGVYNYNQAGYSTSGLRGKVINNDMATLGRVLFYDKALSVSNTIACASCHHQERAFSDGLAFSTGFMGEQTARNSMAIFNMPLNGAYFWDLRRDGLKEMVLDPVQHLVEMGTESPHLLAAKLSEISYYDDLFKRAFGSDTVSADRISLALAEFISSMMSNSSRFDKNQLTPQEQRGQQLFDEAQCSNCHGGRNFNNLSIFNGSAVVSGGGGWGGGSGGGNNGIASAGDFANIGLDYSYPDPGMTPEKQAERGLVEVEQGLFKVPSLRNVALTAPYMHDGRFKTLMDVINHYDHGVKMHNNLDRRLLVLVEGQNGIEVLNEPRRLHLSQGDKEDIIAFLTSLTDETLTTHPRFSDPFRVK